MKHALLVAVLLLAGCSNENTVLDRAEALKMLHSSPKLASVVVENVTGIESDGDGNGHPVIEFTYHDETGGETHAGQALLMHYDDGWRIGQVVMPQGQGQ